MQFKRTIEEKILSSCFLGDVIIIYGARQVGKTTLCKKLWGDQKDALYVSCDDPGTTDLLNNASLAVLKNWLNGYRILIIDEAQRVKTIGITIKLIIDNIPGIQVIATGSSSFGLANNVQEPLTGRTSTFFLHPISIEELRENTPLHEQVPLLEQRMIYGMYPRNIILNDAKHLFELTEAYAYKDLFMHENLKKSDLVVKLLQALALQIGSEVSYNELSQLLSADVKTIQKYITLLEQSFIIFRLPSYARNLRNELKRSQKIYFWDIGVRNGILRNTQPLELRNDVGNIWENFIISERMKYIQNHEIFTNHFFRRNIIGAEIDYIETNFGDQLDAYEIKWSTKKNPSIPKAFKEGYPNASFSVINPNNALSWVMGKTLS